MFLTLLCYFAIALMAYMGGYFWVRSEFARDAHIEDSHGQPWPVETYFNPYHTSHKLAYYLYWPAIRIDHKTTGRWYYYDSE